MGNIYYASSAEVRNPNPEELPKTIERTLNYDPLFIESYSIHKNPLCSKMGLKSFQKLYKVKAKEASNIKDSKFLCESSTSVEIIEEVDVMSFYGEYSEKFKFIKKTLDEASESQIKELNEAMFYVCENSLLKKGNNRVFTNIDLLKKGNKNLGILFHFYKLLEKDYRKNENHNKRGSFKSRAAKRIATGFLFEESLSERDYLFIVSPWESVFGKIKEF